MALPITVETRTGDTPANRRKRQREAPPNILLTTPESLALLLSQDHAPTLFAGLERRGRRRGARPRRHQARRPARPVPGPPDGPWPPPPAAPACPPPSPIPRRCSTTSAARRRPGPDPESPRARPARPLHPAARGTPALVRPHGPHRRLPHPGAHRAPHAMTIVFVNTRAQGELMFQALWKLNDGHAAHRHPSRQPRHRPAPPGRGRDGRRQSCAPSSPPAASTSASTGAASTR